MILFTEPSLQRLYFRIFLNNFLNYMCVGVGRVVRVSASSFGGQKRALDSRELELEAVVSC